MKARGAVVGTLLVVLLLSALYPVRQYFTQKGELRALAAEESQLDRRIKELTAHRSALLTDEEIERIAREELGMVRPGEVAFVVVPGATPGAKRPVAIPALDDGTKSRAGSPWYERWWNAFTRSVTGIR